MKALFLFAFLLLAGVTGYAQTPATPQEAPFKKANVILIQTSDSGAVALKRLATILVQRGYTMKKVDAEYGTLLTEPKVMSFGFRPVLSIRAAVVPGGLKLAGESVTEMGSLGASTSPAQFVGVEGSVYKGCFREIEKVAQAYPAAQVRYAAE